MHLIEVIPCGSLADQYEPLTIGADTAAEAIEGWSRQVCPVGRIPQLIEVVDFETEAQLRDTTEATKLYLYPAMYGGGGLGRYVGIIVGAAMIAGAIIATGGGAAAIFAGTANAFASSVFISGALMMVMGAINLFLPAPSLSKESDPEASKYIGSGDNSTKIGTHIPMGGGRMMVGGHFLSVQVNAQELVYGQFPSSPAA